MGEKVDKGKKEMSSEIQASIIQMQHSFGDLRASSSSTAIPPGARWIDVIEKEKEDFQPFLKHKPLRTWAFVVEDEWVKGSKIWENAFVGYVMGLKPTFKDMANFVNNRWREFQVPKVFMLRNGVFLYDFAEANANLGKLASYVGIPIATDALTTKRQRVAYARMLVETEIKDTLPRVVPIIGPKGVLGMKRGTVMLRQKKVWVPKKAIMEQQSKFRHAAGKMIVESNEQCLVQPKVGVLRQGNLLTKIGTSTSDKGTMQNATGGTSSVSEVLS
ncbi:hypothetical protein SLEP1_g24802 [Rubroshorea leprosula]|uniref:Uncharacterized protein n=1 Tax=Rubroshorea leprosula TaxID=152421 RepID=A0AAV5JR13_9ROSI|nr:hypothetical protein SLEP1_g24802 [Rubroshorea leprosula]